MLTTQLPGFKDPVHDAQQTFRALLDALARPGIQQTTASLTPPEGLNPGCAAACLTLLDLETTVWLQPGISESVRSWLLFHTGCRFTAQPQTADFAVIDRIETMPRLEEFNWGTAAYPEASTSLLIQLPALQGAESATLHGPGILDTVTIQMPLVADFWQQWQAMTTNYPLGLDIWCFADRQVLGLPRTARFAGQQEGQ
ncbi:phosphonate C-P lyase system protein PhnH [Nodosilinea sp. FACHB-13]|uniref:phosphonate C-P lyase system protein PhnH n=1 Tax=Cyanophyceae TaxID=3028117 RepID=UPI001686579D|nr:phosphonate C-P lyase system protein PhnH [Nodosilinea sp. FACHB-13]MBD2108084.1 phosphonate C-P lyase system protein PhnH [Nodosilinea sp. FACHB-13]